MPDPSSNRPLLLVGAGKMGAALLGGWLDGGIDPESVVVVDPDPPPDSRQLLRKAGVSVHSAPPSGLVAMVVVLAVKPQMMDAVLPVIRDAVGADTTVLSIAAGTPLARLEGGLGSVGIVRSMPNTPAQVGRGITVAIGNERVRPEARELIDRLLGSVGEVAWLDDEGAIDAVTAVSGSGPAYVFLLAECLAEAAVEAGLPRDLALRLARGTVEGAGELLYRSEMTPTELRRNVTSPGGTTAAALTVLMGEDGLEALLKKAVAAAKRRSEELAG
ncbi:MAG: pyrroline-5-carboxylate reductase [Hyphomicrobiales bacterium]|nr:pyrroline-5-carboxylate reductase [Hyphomicrobiales bacterium]